MKNFCGNRVFIAALLFFVSFVSCTDSRVALPETPILRDQTFGVVLPMYSRIYREPFDNGKVLFLLRRGDILSIERTIILPGGNWIMIWHKNRSGWIARERVRFTQTQRQAEKLSLILR